MRTLLKKLKSSRGESLGETLVSLLIASLAIVLLAIFGVALLAKKKK